MDDALICFSAGGSLTDDLPMREKVLRLEEALKRGPTIELPVKHYFAHGLYARELLIPAGTVLTGKIHREGHINVISQGDISVLTEHGIKRLRAPCTIVSSAGIKRAGYAHTDTIWTTFHANPEDETDLDKLEATLIVPSFAALEEGLKVESDVIASVLEHSGVAP